jgi:hypothetical protein
VDTAFGLRDWDSLNPVDAPLVFETAPGVSTLDHKDNFIESVALGGTLFEHFDLEPSSLRIMLIHLIEISRKKISFFSTFGATNLHDDVSSIVGIFWKQQCLEFFFDLKSEVMCPIYFFAKLFSLRRVCDL